MSDESDKPAVDDLKQPPPGSFRTSSDLYEVNREEVDEFRRKDRAERDRSARDKETYLSQLEDRGEAPIELVNFLRRIKSSTFGNQDSVSLDKIKATMQLKDKFGKGIEGRIAYVGSGLDWHFPVALGARDIDMVDSEYTDERVLEMLESAKEFDDSAELTDEPVPAIRFNIDLGNPSAEAVVLRLHQKRVEDYAPDYPLAGVIEVLGPSKGFLDMHISPVMPNIAARLLPGSFVANFDYHEKAPPFGLSKIVETNYPIFMVGDPQKLQEASNIAETK